MVQACPAEVGQRLDQVETPALVVELGAYERNLERMAAALAGWPVALRPHAKTHKSPVVALEQIARGAVGVCCQKVGEAHLALETHPAGGRWGAYDIARIAADCGWRPRPLREALAEYRDWLAAHPY